MWVLIIETWVCVGIWSCDKLSHKSLCEARETIEPRYNQERQVY